MATIRNYVKGTEEQLLKNAAILEAICPKSERRPFVEPILTKAERRRLAQEQCDHDFKKRRGVIRCVNCKLRVSALFAEGYEARKSQGHDCDCY